MKSRSLTAQDFIPSFRGRMRRVPFTVLTMASYALFIWLIQMWSAQSDGTPLRIGLHVLTLMIFPLKFCLASRRFHDLNLSLLLGSHYLLLTIAGVYNNYAVTYLDVPAWTSAGGTIHLFNHDLSYATLIGIVILASIPLTDLALMVVRGTRGANRYGPDPRTLGDQSMSEVF